MKNRLCLFITLCCVSIVSAQFKLPDSNFSPGWEKESALLVFQKNDLYGYIDGGAELFHEFGFENLTVQSYFQGAAELTLEVYQMQNPTAALGIYLMKCGKETPLAGIDARNTGSHLQATIVKNNIFVQINNFSGNQNTQPDMIKLASALLSSIAPAAPVKILELLPRESLIKGSERIIRGPFALEPIFTFGEGDIFQLDGKIFAVLGDYQISENAAYTNIFIPYPDEKTAGIAFKNVAKNFDPYLQIIDQDDDALVFKDFQNQFGKIRLAEKMIDIKIHLQTKPALSDES